MSRREKTTRIHLEGGSLTSDGIDTSSHGNMPYRCNWRTNVATADIPGAFIQATMDDDVWIKFENEMLDVLVELYPNLYGSCVCYHNGRKFLYAKAIKAIYGAMKSALLFYQQFSGQLTDWGFKKNDYDMCTMNKTVNGSQLTIVWHVDDCNLSC